MKETPPLTMPTLRKQFQEAFGWTPPTSMKRQFLEGNLHYHQQTRQHGGLSRKTIGQLRDIATKAAANKGYIPTVTAATYKPDTRLIRIYKGQSHEVTITAEGFIYNDKSYTSLSAIARHITGTPWNGRVFFGLKDKVA